MIRTIEETAAEILARNPGAVVRYRLLRDVLQRPRDDAELQGAQESLQESRRIQALAAEQWKDGSWGAFHSRSTRRKQKIPSTEMGVARALSLGLDASHPILQKAAKYILNIMPGRIDFPDYHEKNNRWPTGMRLFLASTLSLVHPTHPILDDDRALWREIAKRTFQSGKYSQEDEIKAHAELTGATVKDSYLVLNGRYQLNLLGSIPGTLSAGLERLLLQWLWERPDGIGYLGMPLQRPPEPARPGPFDRWLASLELLARAFPTWAHFAQGPMEWLWDQRSAQGFWDFGPRSSSTSYLPLSDTWRDRKHRLFDWTTRVLVLIHKYYERNTTPSASH